MKKVELSVGLTQDFEHRTDRKKAFSMLENIENSGEIIEYISELESLFAVEKYSTLSVMANDMREHLAEIRISNNDDFNRGYQRAINLVIDKLEEIDIDSQAATSIMEMMSAAVRDAQTLCKNTDDYQAIGNYAKAIEDGAQ